MNVRLSTSDEQPMQASKWLDIQALIDADEMSMLLNELGSPGIYMTGCICSQNEANISNERFLEGYNRYIQILKNGALPFEKEFRPLFSSIITAVPEVVYAIPVEGGKQILRTCRPAIQMQFHRLGYSKADGKFRPMAFGTQSIFWGIQFSYPQLFLDQNTDEVFSVFEGEHFPNTPLFKKIQKWMRQHTIPTPFLVGNERINVPMRLGKQCLPWINNHPQLKEHLISVVE